MNTIVTLTSLITTVKTRALAIGTSWRHLVNTIVTLTSLITMVKTRALAIGMSWRHLVNMMVYRYELAPPGEYDGS